MLFTSSASLSRICAICTRPQTTSSSCNIFRVKSTAHASTSEKTEQFQTTHHFSKSYQPKHSPWYRRGLGENQAAISSLLGPVLSRCDSTYCLGKGKVAGLALCDRSKHRSHDGEPPKLQIPEKRKLSHICVPSAMGSNFGWGFHEIT